MSIKTVILEPENHEYVKDLAFINNSTIQKEVNLIIDKNRKNNEVNIYVTKNKS